MSAFAPVVVVHLDAESSARVRQCYPNAIDVTSPSHLLTTAARSNAHLVVADPLLDDRGCGAVLRRIRAELPSVLVAVYATLTPDIARELIALGALGVDEVVLRGCDDTPSRFLALGARSVANPVALEARRLLDDRIRCLPPALAAAVIRLFDTPARFRTTDDLAAAAFMTRRGVYRSLELAGVKSPRLLIASARVLRAAALLAGGARSLRDVSTSLGYSKPEYLSEQLREFTGRRAREFRNDTSLVEVARTVVSRL